MARNIPLPRTDALTFYKFLSFSRTLTADVSLTTARYVPPTSAAHPKKSLKLFIKSFFVPQLKY